MSKPLIPTEEYDNIVALYNSGLSQAKVGERYNVGYYIIGKILRKCGVKIRDDSHKFRKYTLDFIYNDADLYIERKYNVYQKICMEMNINDSLLN